MTIAAPRPIMAGETLLELCERLETHGFRIAEQQAEDGIVMTCAVGIFRITVYVPSGTAKPVVWFGWRVNGLGADKLVPYRYLSRREGVEDAIQYVRTLAPYR